MRVCSFSEGDALARGINHVLYGFCHVLYCFVIFNMVSVIFNMVSVIFDMVSVILKLFLSSFILLFDVVGHRLTSLT